MKEKTIERVYTSTTKLYIAEDGTEFNNEDECIIYESELDLNRYADKYKMKFISVPTFICESYANGISFYFPQDGDKNEVIRLLSIYQNYCIDKYCGKWEIDYSRDFSNVRSSDLEIKIPFELNKEDNYIFYYSWEECCDTYDYFYNRVVSREKAREDLEIEIKIFEKIFGTKFEE